MKNQPNYIHNTDVCFILPGALQVICFIGKINRGQTMCNIRSQICIWSIVWLISPNQPTFLMKTNVHVRICEFHLVKELTLYRNNCSHHIRSTWKKSLALLCLYYITAPLLTFLSHSSHHSPCFSSRWCLMNNSRPHARDPVGWLFLFPVFSPVASSHWPTSQ